MKVRSHVAQNTSRRKSAVHDHIAATNGYIISQQKRKLIEPGFGWTKLTGPIRQIIVRGLEKVDQLFVLTMAACKLTRTRTLEQIRQQTMWRQKNDAKRPQNNYKSTPKKSDFQIANKFQEVRLTSMVRPDLHTNNLAAW